MGKGKPRLKVVHIITSLYIGGANMMLYKLVSKFDRNEFETEVVSLMDVGPIGQKIQEMGIPVRAIGMHQGQPNPISVLRLARWLQLDPPDVIQTWTYHADLVGGLAARLAGGSIPVVWGIRHTTFDPQGTKRMTVWTAKACACLSRWLPARIVCCADASLKVHIKMGYVADKMLVIPNGFDLEVFRPDPLARKSVRQELGIPEKSPLIGMVARFDPQKDQRNFVRTAAIFHAFLPESHFLLCGDEIVWENQELSGWIEAAGIRNWCHLLGRREDIPRLTAALDIATLSSAYGEAFPNVIGEAMACDVPCVVTDVGDSAIIVGNTGVVVPPKNPQALADGWIELLVRMTSYERQQLGQAARLQIVERYDLVKIVKEYECMYRAVVRAGEQAAV